MTLKRILAADGSRIFDFRQLAAPDVQAVILFMAFFFPAADRAAESDTRNPCRNYLHDGTALCTSMSSREKANGRAVS